MKKIKANFPIGGMLFLTILGLLGLGLMLSPIIKAIKEAKLTTISNGLVLILFGLVFFIFCLYAWIAFFKNIVIKPKEETLYLLDDNIFLDKKGKKFYSNSKNFEKRKYYKVFKTIDYIIEIREESKEKFNLKIKEKFWLNWYSPHGDFEEVLLLPILYLFFSMFFIVSILSAFPFNIIIGSIGIYPLYYILYDIKKKIEKNKENKKLINNLTKSD